MDVKRRFRFSTLYLRVLYVRLGSEKDNGNAKAGDENSPSFVVEVHVSSWSTCQCGETWVELAALIPGLARPAFGQYSPTGA